VGRIGVKRQSKIKQFRELVEDVYEYYPTGCGGSFGEILCYEIHENPINPRMKYNDGSRGLTFLELAEKWGISVVFLGELIADHCKKSEQL